MTTDLLALALLRGKLRHPGPNEPVPIITDEACAKRGVFAASKLRAREKNTHSVNAGARLSIAVL
jgi:hypothetical protein